MIYGINLKQRYDKRISGPGILAHNIELDEYWKQRDKKVKYGVAYLICKDLDCGRIWTGHQHISGIKECKISIADIDTIAVRSNLDETDEKWKTIVKGTTGSFSYAKENRVTEKIRKLLK